MLYPIVSGDFLLNCPELFDELPAALELELLLPPQPAIRTIVVKPSVAVIHARLLRLIITRALQLCYAIANLLISPSLLRTQFPPLDLIMIRADGQLIHL